MKIVIGPVRITLAGLNKPSINLKVEIMRAFRFNDKIEVVCESKNTRNGFKHEATLMINGHQVDKTKVCYLNRTWERFTYATVVSRMIDKATILSTEEKAFCYAELSKMSY
jgi:hypothetical protein